MNWFLVIEFCNIWTIRKPCNSPIIICAVRHLRCITINKCAYVCVRMKMAERKNTGTLLLACWVAKIEYPPLNLTSPSSFQIEIELALDFKLYLVCVEYDIFSVVSLFIKSSNPHCFQLLRGLFVESDNRKSIFWNSFAYILIVFSSPLHSSPDWAPLHSTLKFLMPTQIHMHMHTDTCAHMRAHTHTPNNKTKKIKQRQHFFNFCFLTFWFVTAKKY